MGCPSKYLRLCPLQRNRCTKTKNTAQIREQIKTPEKIQLIDEELANLSDAQVNIPVIKMLTEMAEYGHKIEEKLKGMKIELKVNQPTVKGRKLVLISTVWTRRKK